jgi:hypothetical protein
MLSAFSEESVASRARLALALILMAVLAVIVISDALSMVISALAEQDRISVAVLAGLTFDISWLFDTSQGYHTIWATGTKRASIAPNR